MKKILSIILILTLCFTLFACGSGNNVKFTYEVPINTASITGAEGHVSGDIVIPKKIDGYPVTMIKFTAFQNYTEITGVTIPGSVKYIQMLAFDGCTSLTSVTLKKGVETIDIWAFNGCVNLTSITIPDSVTEINEFAFDDCDNLTIYANEGSYAYQFAKDNNIKVSPVK